MKSDISLKLLQIASIYNEKLIFLSSTTCKVMCIAESNLCCMVLFVSTFEQRETCYYVVVDFVK